MSSHQTSAISDLAKVFKGDVHAQALLYPHKRTKEQTPLSLFKFFRRKVSLFCIPFASQAYLPTYKCDQKNRQMSINVAQNDFTRKMIDLQKFPKNVGDLGKLIVVTGL